MKKEIISKFSCGLIAALFFYAAFSKLMDYDKSVDEMRSQIFPSSIASILTWLIPSIELLLTFCLLFPSTKTIALWASLFLLSAFTIYIGIVMTGVFGRIPCSCGGILKNMSYGAHLIFNLFFIAISLLGLAIANNWTINNNWFHLKKERSLPDN